MVNDSLTVPDGTKYYADKQNGKYGVNTDPNRGADTFIPFKGEQVLTFTGYQYYSSPVCMISAKNLSSLKVVQRRNEPLRGFYSNKFGNGSSVKFLDISVAGTYEINLSNMPSDAVILSIYYSGNTAESMAIDFDAIVTYG